MAVALRDLERAPTRRRPSLRLLPSEPPPTPPSVFWLRRALVLGVVVALVLGGLAVRRVVADPSPVPPASLQMTVVMPAGGSLWGLAERYAPQRDPADWIADVVRRNDLGGGVVRAGTPLVVPVEVPAVPAVPVPVADEDAPVPVPVAGVDAPVPAAGADAPVAR